MANQPTVEMDMELELDYKMDHPKRGKAIIFNHYEFKDPRLEPRDGTRIDKDLFGQVLLKWGFQESDIVLLDDFNLGEIKDYLQKAKNDDYSDCDAFVCAIFTHGDRNRLCSWDAVYSSSRIWGHFTDDQCPTLKDKPKIFIVQACRGRKKDPGVKIKDPMEETINLHPNDDVNSIPMDVKTDFPRKMKFFFEIPHSDPDILVAYSTADNHFSFRNVDYGSWFIAALHLVVMRSTNEDLVEILTLVNKTVAMDYESKSGERMLNKKKQMPNFHSTLTKRLYF